MSGIPAQNSASEKRKKIDKALIMTYLTRDQERLSTPHLSCVCGKLYAQTEPRCHAHCSWCHVVTPMEELDEYEVCCNCRADNADRQYDRIRDSLMMQQVSECPECSGTTISGVCQSAICKGRLL